MNSTLGNSMKIAFLLGDAAISGGTYVILQHALYLKRIGHDVTIFFIYFNCKKWHEAFDNITFKYIYDYKNEHFDIAIATWWKTVFFLEKIKATQKLYFVQSIESFFINNSQFELKKEINSTYKINLPIITESSWIKNYLKKKYNSDATVVKNGIRKDYLFPPANGGLKRRVLIEGPVDVDFKNVPRTIALCKKYSSFEIWLLTSSPIKSFPGVSKVFSNIPAHQVGDIYRECDYIVKLSYVEGMFAPPLEMFHCGGTAIVYNVTGHEEYMFNNFNSIIIKESDEKALGNAIQSLEKDPKLLSKLKYNAIITASLWPDWSISSKNFSDAILAASTKQLHWENLYTSTKTSRFTLMSFLSKIPFFLTFYRKFCLNVMCPYLYPFLPNRGKRKKDIEL